VPAQQGFGETSRSRRGWVGSSRLSALRDGAVDPAQVRARVVSAQHGDFVAEHQDLDVLGCIGSGE
jgi:hypothetical protein